MLGSCTVLDTHMGGTGSGGCGVKDFNAFRDWFIKSVRKRVEKKNYGEQKRETSNIRQKGATNGGYGKEN